MDCVNDCPAYPVCYSTKAGPKCLQVLERLKEKRPDLFDAKPCCQDNEWLCSVCGKSARYY